MSEEKSLSTLNAGASEFETLQRQCKAAVISGLLPSEYRKGDQNVQLAKATVVALKGRELGIPMMQAFSQVHVINGKPTLSAELMLALIYREHPNADIDFVQNDAKACIIEAARPNKKKRPFSFSMQDAEAAGLLSNPTWKKYPRAMLRSRAVSEMARSIFPDAIMGCSYTPEEMGAVVDGEGAVIDEPAEPKDVTPQTNQNASQEPQTVSGTETDVTPQKNQSEGSEGAQNGRQERPLTDKQIKRLYAIAKSNGWVEAEFKASMKELVGVESTKDLDKQRYDFLCDFFEKTKAPQPPDEPETKGYFDDVNTGPEPDFESPFDTSDIPNSAPEGGRR